MDTNYSRWIHNADGDDANAVVEEPRRLRIRRPSRLVVAAGSTVTLIALGIGALAYSDRGPETSTTQQSSVASTDHDPAGPGAASVEDSDSAADDSASDDSAASSTEDSVAVEPTTEVSIPPRLLRQRGAPDRLPPRLRFEARSSNDMPPGPPPGRGRFRGWREVARSHWDSSDLDSSDSDSSDSDSSDSDGDG